MIGSVVDLKTCAAGLLLLITFGQDGGDEAPLLHLITAILAEVSEEWETGRIYLQVDD